MHQSYTTPYRIPLHLDEQARITEPHTVSRRRSKHGHIRRAVHLSRFQFNSHPGNGRGNMRKPLLDRQPHDAVYAHRIDGTGGQGIAAGHDALSGNRTEGDGLGVARLEADGGACGDIQTFAVRETAVER
jgi:hypothetical protein